MSSGVDFRDYDPRWPVQFEELKSRFEEVLPESARIDHIGSTAVPGLAAKACIDILITVSRADLGATTSALVGRGLEHRPASFADDADRRFLRLLDGDRRVAHVHLLADDHSAGHAMRAVRDLLRDDPDWRRGYEVTKRLLAENHPDDRAAYIEGKDGFVRDLTRAAVDRARTDHPGRNRRPRCT